VNEVASGRARARGAAIEVVHLGRLRYADAMARMEARAAERTAGTAPDTLFLLEHEPVITMGRRADTTNILRSPEQLQALGVEVHETGRGGDVTYHGPGQLVAYPVFDLRPERQDVRRYVSDLEEAMIRTVARWGIRADRVPKLNGTWVDGQRKIGAVGVRISRWVTTHGLALNVNTDLDAFSVIVPCGIRDRAVTSMARELGRPVPMSEVMTAMEAVFREVFA
jgi:lipoyl(octanoyl) transferase